MYRIFQKYVKLKSILFKDKKKIILNICMCVYDNKKNSDFIGILYIKSRKNT